MHLVNFVRITAAARVLALPRLLSSLEKPSSIKIELALRTTGGASVADHNRVYKLHVQCNKRQSSMRASEVDEALVCEHNK